MIIVCHSSNLLGWLDQARPFSPLSRDTVYAHRQRRLHRQGRQAVVEDQQKTGHPVIITFLDDDVSTQLAAAKAKYQELSKHFDFGETPDESYAQEMMAEYFSSFSKI
jgi:hypothetical protein